MLYVRHRAIQQTVRGLHFVGFSIVHGKLILVIQARHEVPVVKRHRLRSGFEMGWFHLSEVRTGIPHLRTRNTAASALGIGGEQCLHSLLWHWTYKHSRGGRGDDLGKGRVRAEGSKRSHLRSPRVSGIGGHCLHLGLLLPLAAVLDRLPHRYPRLLAKLCAGELAFYLFLCNSCSCTQECGCCSAAFGRVMEAWTPATLCSISVFWEVPVRLLFH